MSAAVYQFRDVRGAPPSDHVVERRLRSVRPNAVDRYPNLLHVSGLDEPVRPLGIRQGESLGHLGVAAEVERHPVLGERVVTDQGRVLWTLDLIDELGSAPAGSVVASVEVRRG